MNFVYLIVSSIDLLLIKNIPMSLEEPGASRTGDLVDTKDAPRFEPLACIIHLIVSLYVPENWKSDKL